MRCFFDSSFLDLEIINNIRFSLREVDIVSCIINGRSPKFIAHLLDISPKTVEAHIRNIKIKMNCSSKEQIVSFIEKSNKHQLISQHYRDLIVNTEFEKSLQKISAEITNKNLKLQIICLIKNDNQEDIKCCKLIKHLSMAGIKANLEYKTLNNLDFSENNYVLLCSVQTAQKIRDQHKEQIKNITFFTDGSLDIEQKDQIINYANPNNYYSAILELISKFYSSEQIESLISKFRSIYEVKSSDCFINDQITESKYSWNKYKILTALCLILTFLIYFFLHFYTSTRSKDINLYTQFIGKDILLPRKNLIHKIDEIFEKQNDIKYVILIGEGGIGKTVISRHYLQSNDFKVKAEINAETYNSISDSFVNLAITLANTKELQEKLSYIQAITNYKRRNKQVFLFVLSQLKEIGNWCLLFDNVVDFNLIRDFIPSNDGTHNDGKIIITTRNENFKNITIFPQFCAINIPLLTVNEQEELFSKIIYGKSKENSATHQSVLKNFLKNIPFMPLDICTAAFYIKNTHISFDDYLKISNNPCQSTEKIQSTFLAEGINYDKTRYGIISSVFEKIIKTNSDFKELLLFICLLDSQNIPRAYLEKCKDHTVVQDFIHNLRRYSLITEKNDTFSIHRSIQEAGLTILNKLENGNAILLKEAISRIAAYKSFIEGWYRNKAYSYDYSSNIVKHLESMLHKLRFYRCDKKILDECRLRILLSLFYAKKSSMPKESLCLGNEILKLINKTSVLTKYDAALLYVNMAKLYANIGDFDKCLQSANQCIYLAKKFNFRELLAPGLVFISRYDKKLTKNKKHQMVNDAIKIIESLPNCYYGSIIDTANQIYRFYGTNYINQPPTALAVNFLQKMSLKLSDFVSIFEFSPCLQDFLEMKMNMLRGYNRLGEFDNALLLINELEIKYQKLKKLGINVCVAKARLDVEKGFVFLRQNDLIGALNLFSQIIDLKFLEEITDLFYVYVYRAEALIRLNRFEEAYKDCISAINHRESSFNSKYAQLTKLVCYYNIVMCAYKMKKKLILDKYRELFFKESKSFCETFLPKHEFNQLIQKNNFNSEEQGMLKKCKNIFEKIYGNNHPFIKDYINANLNDGE